MNKTIKLSILSLSFLVLISYQACSRWANPEHGDYFASANANLMEMKIWSMSSGHVLNNDIIFYVNPNLFGENMSYNWSTNASACTVERGPIANSTKVSCSAGENITVSVDATKPDYSIINIKLEVELISEEEALENHGEGPYVLADSELYLNLDGSPGPAYNDGSNQDESPYPSSSEGEELYNYYCARCHGSFRSNTIEDRTFDGIKSKLEDIPQMQNIKISDDDVQTIVNALNL